jgi:hypothetical protein
MSYTKELKFFWNLLWNPGVGSKRQMDVGGALKLYYMLAVLPFIAYLVIGGLAVSVGYSVNAIDSNTVFAPIFAMVKSFSYVSLFWNGIVLFFIALPIGIIVDAVIYQIIGRFFLKMWNGDYSKTLTALVYSLFPVLLLAWLNAIPVVNTIFIVLAPIWSIVIFVIAMSAQQKITRLNALIIMLVKSILVFLVVFLLGLALLSSFAYALTSGLVPAGTAFMHWYNISQGTGPIGSQWGIGPQGMIK